MGIPSKLFPWLVFVAAALLTAGCTPTILRANFDSFATGVTPAGSLPGEPGNDSIDAYVAELGDQGKPIKNVFVTAGNGGLVVPIHNVGKSLAFWRYQSPSDGNGTVRMTSRVVTGGSSKRLNVFWDGKKYATNADFDCDLFVSSGALGGFQKVMSLRFDGNTIKATDPAPYFKTVANLTPSLPYQDPPIHEVFISFNPLNNTYSLRITPEDNNVISFDGATPVGAGALVENSSSRLLLYCAQNATGSSVVPSYMIDNVRMRAKPK